MNLFGFIVFDLPVLIIGIILLPFFITLLLRYFFKKQMSLKVGLVFGFWCAFFGLAADLIWINKVVDHLYHEWDRILIWAPFSFFHHEGPVLTDPVLGKSAGVWIASGWTLQKLDYLWMGMVAGCVLLAYLATLLCFFKNRKKILIDSKSLFIVGICFIAICFGVRLLMGQYALMLVNPFFAISWLQAIQNPG